MIFRFMDANKADFPIRFMASRLGVSTSGIYGWRHRQTHPSRCTCEDRQLTETICEIWRQSRGTYGSPRIWAELRLGQDVRVGRKRVERLMRPNHGTQYTSWAFGQRLRKAGLLGSMGTVGDALDNAMAESFFSTLQLELLDRKRWATRRQLAQAIFEYIEAFYNPTRRHSAINDLTPITYEHP